MTENTQTQAKRYNLVGEIADLVTRDMKEAGKQFVTFNLKRGEQTVSCVAFDEKAQQLLAQGFGNGSTVKLFGVYEDRSFEAKAEENGQSTTKTVKTKRFKIFWSGKPTVKAPEATEAAVAA